MSDRTITRLRVAVTVGLALFVVIGLVTADPPAEDRAREIGSLVRCPSCQGESIADSPAALAEDMMALVRLRIDEGRSDEQIIEELVSSYSGSQLLDPPVTIETLALWVIPALVLLLGTLAALSRTRPEEAPAPTRGDAP